MDIVLKRTNTQFDDVSVEVPSSKSISNRLLIIKFLSGSVAEIADISSSDDTQMLKKFLQQTANKTNTTFDCKNAGTVIRFLIALLSLTDGTWFVKADKRMQTRPLLPLLDALRQLGAQIEVADNKNIFPIRIIGRQLYGNTTIKLSNSLTSQIISALLLISPYVKGGFTLELPPEQVSKPYIDMTVSLVNMFGGQIIIKDNLLVCNESQYFFNGITVEKDYSSVCFFYLFVAVGKIKSLRVKSLQPSLLQGDFQCVNIFSHIGVTTLFDKNGAVLLYDDRLVSAKQSFTFDLGDFPDIFPALATACYLSGKATHLINLASLRVKESDRLENMCTELNKLGQRCEIKDDTFIIKPILSYAENKASFGVDETLFGERKVTFGESEATLSNNKKFNDLDKVNFNDRASLSANTDNILAKCLTFDSYNDHRIAMALSAVSLVCSEIKILNSDCVTKSFPDFWQQIRPFAR